MARGCLRSACSTLTGSRSAFWHDSDEPGGFDRIDEHFHNWPRAPGHRRQVRVVEVFSLLAKCQLRPDLLLLLSLLLAILLTPVLDHDNWSRLVLAAVTFIPVVLSTIRLSQVKGWVWPSVLLASGNLIFVVAGNTFRSRIVTGVRWGFLAAFFAFTAAGLFSHLRNTR